MTEELTCNPGTCLSEMVLKPVDIPEYSFTDKEIGKQNLNQLKFWLKCRRIRQYSPCEFSAKNSQGEYSNQYIISVRSPVTRSAAANSQGEYSNQYLISVRSAVTRPAVCKLCHTDGINIFPRIGRRSWTSEEPSTKYEISSSHLWPFKGESFVYTGFYANLFGLPFILTGCKWL